MKPETQYEPSNVSVRTWRVSFTTRDLAKAGSTELHDRMKTTEFCFVVGVPRSIVK